MTMCEVSYFYYSYFRIAAAITLHLTSKKVIRQPILEPHVQMMQYNQRFKSFQFISAPLYYSYDAFIQIDDNIDLESLSIEIKKLRLAIIRIIEFKGIESEELVEKSVLKSAKDLVKVCVAWGILIVKLQAQKEKRSNEIVENQDDFRVKCVSIYHPFLPVFIEMDKSK